MPPWKKRHLWKERVGDGWEKERERERERERREWEWKQDWTVYLNCGHLFTVFHIWFLIKWGLLRCCKFIYIDHLCEQQTRTKCKWVDEFDVWWWYYLRFGPFSMSAYGIQTADTKTVIRRYFQDFFSIG